MLMTRAPLLIAHSSPAQNVPGGGLRPLLGLRAESVDGEDAGAGRDAHELAMRHDRAGHSGAVRMRLVAPADGVEPLDDGALEVGMLEVDLGIDHRHQHIASGRHAMNVAQPQLVDDVLCGIAGARACRQAGVLLQPEHVVRLGNADVLRFQGAHDVGDRPSLRDAEMEESSAGEAEALRADGGQAEPAGSVVDRLLRDVGADLKDHFVRHETGLPGGRHAGEAAFAWERPVRQSAASDQDRSSMVDPESPLCGRERFGQCPALADARNGCGSFGKGRGGLVTIGPRPTGLAQGRARRGAVMQAGRALAGAGALARRRALGQRRAADRGLALAQRSVFGSLARMDRRIDGSGIARQAETNRPDQAQ